MSKILYHRSDGGESDNEEVQSSVHADPPTAVCFQILLDRNIVNSIATDAPWHWPAGDRYTGTIVLGCLQGFSFEFVTGERAIQASRPLFALQIMCCLSRRGQITWDASSPPLSDLLAKDKKSACLSSIADSLIRRISSCGWIKFRGEILSHDVVQPWMF